MGEEHFQTYLSSPLPLLFFSSPPSPLPPFSYPLLVWSCYRPPFPSSFSLLTYWRFPL